MIEKATTFHCRHCGDKRKMKPIGIRTRNKTWVINRTLEYIQKTDKRYVTKEEIAFHLKCKIHQVEHALHILNLEGFVSQPTHSPPHDSTRDRCGGCDSSWIADSYKIERKDNVN